MAKPSEKTESPKTSYNSMVPAVAQASKVLICLAQNRSPKMNLTEICSSVGIHRSKGYSILNTLQQFGFVVRDDEDKRYSLGPGLISLSRSVLEGMNIREIIIPFLESLAAKTQSTALFGVINGGNFFVVANSEAPTNVGVTIRIGHRFSVTAGAHGKAIVAFMPPEEQKQVLRSKKLYFHGADRKPDRARIDLELKKVRETGYAIDIGELNPGINAVASPVFGLADRLTGAIFVIGTFPESRADEFGRFVNESAKEISRALGANVVTCYDGGR